MKKTLLVATMLAGALSAQAGVAISEATYGIINIPIIAGMNAVGISLLPMTAEADRIHDVVLPEGLKDNTEGEGDKLTVWDGTSYSYHLAEGNVWTNGTASPPAALGQGVWIKAVSAATIYQVGVVSAEETKNIAVADAAGHNFVANPYPAALTIGDLNWEDVCASGKTANTGDLLRLWTGTKYDTYYYYNNITSNLKGWYSSDNKGRTPPLVLAGEGFWFQRKTVGTTPPTVANPL